MADFCVVSFLIDSIFIIGRKHGVLAGSDRVMDRIIAATAAQAGKNAVTFSLASIVRVRAKGGSRNAAQQRQEQTGENGANKHFGDRLHIFPANLSRAKESIALRKNDVNCDFICSCFA